MSEIVKNVGWWGVPPTGDDIKSFSGTIVWPKRDLEHPCPSVGDTIVDQRGGKLVGFEVKSVNDSGIISDENNYLEVACDGYTYSEDES